MNTLSLTARLIAAAAAVAITLTLLGTVFAIAEPQRSVGISCPRVERQEPLRFLQRGVPLASV
jgi:hypothetical protein